MSVSSAKDDADAALVQQEKNVEFYVKSLSEVSRKVSELEKKLLAEEKKLKCLEKITERHVARVLDNTGTEGGCKLQASRFKPGQIGAICDLLQKDLTFMERFTGCNIDDCQVEIIKAGKDEVLRLFTVKGIVMSIQFTIKILSRLDLMTATEREVSVNSVKFSPSPSELNSFHDYLLETPGTSYLLIRALRTFQEKIDEMTSVHNALNNSPIAVVVKRYSVTFTYIPSVLQESDVPQEDRTFKLQWKVVFRETCQNFTHDFKLTVPNDVLALYSTKNIAPILSGDEPLKSADEVKNLLQSLF